MLPGSTLFLDVCLQDDLWAGGRAALVNEGEAARIIQLLALAAALGIRQGGVVCRHDEAPLVDGLTTPHCVGGTAGAARPVAAALARPTRIVDVDAAIEMPTDRTAALYLTSGCAAAPDAGTAARVFDHLTSGIRDAVVFGAGLEYGVDRVIDACLRRRIRTHVPLDAIGARDPAVAQRVIAVWKRRTVDGATAMTLERLLRRGAGGR